MNTRYNDIYLYVDYMASMKISKHEAIEILQNYFVDPTNTPSELSASFIQDNMGEIVTAIKTSLKFVSENREYIIKTFEQFKGDNLVAQLKALKHLKDIEILVKVISTGYEMPRTKKSNSTFDVIEFGDGWYIYADSILYTNQIEKNNTKQTLFINDDLKVSLAVTSNYYSNFWDKSDTKQLNVQIQQFNVDFEIEQVMYYKSDANEEYFIELTSEISSVIKKIINIIKNK